MNSEMLSFGIFESGFWNKEPGYRSDEYLDLNFAPQSIGENLHSGCVTEFLLSLGHCSFKGCARNLQFFRTFHLVHFYYLFFWEAKVKLVLFPPWHLHGGCQNTTEPRTFPGLHQSRRNARQSPLHSDFGTFLGFSVCVCGGGTYYQLFFTQSHYFKTND